MGTDTPYIYAFLNSSGETMPGYAIGRLDTPVGRLPGGEPIFDLVKPDGATGIYVVNRLGATIPNGGHGSGIALQRATSVLALPSVVFGDSIGAIEGEWYASTEGSGLTCLDVPNDDDVCPVQPDTAVATGGGASSCPCVCIEEGDAVVNGIVTTSRWSIAMKQEIFRGSFGDIIFPAGGYTVVLNPAGTEWVLDIGDVLTAIYLDGSSATADTTMDGELKMVWGAYGPVVTLCVDGSVPEPV